MPLSAMSIGGEGAMLLKEVSVKNFKSFSNTTVKLDKFNVLIGPNASGKSNFVSILQFFQDAVIQGLGEAVSMYGGVEYIRNVVIGKDKDLEVEVRFGSDTSKRFLHQRKGKSFEFLTKELSYSFALGFTGKRDYFVKQEKITGSFEMRTNESTKEKINFEKNETVSKGEFTLNRDSKGKLEGYLTPKTLPITFDKIVPLFSIKKLAYGIKPNRRELFFNDLMLLSVTLGAMYDFFKKLKIYNIDPRISKKPCHFTGGKELNPDGSNLAVVLRNILSNRKTKKRFLDILVDLIDFTKNTSIAELDDRSFLLFLKEVYTNKSLPAFLISDGTINLVAFVIVLFFGNEQCIVIEEPERNIHPSLLSDLVDMMKDVSLRMNKQIIVTTHNPEFVRSSGLENLLLIYRNEQGFSDITNPKDKKEVQNFLEKKVGIEELFIQNLLGD